MANQIVVIGNRVVAHGTDCFADVGGAVVCLINGEVYGGASIVECSTECPADIDTVGYEYHGGVFVKCAPFFKGDGTVAVWCDECKAPIDSGFPSQFLGKMFHTTYIGTGTSSVSVTCGFKPKLAIVTGQYSVSGTSCFCTAIVSVDVGVLSATNKVCVALTPSIGEDFIGWTGNSAELAMNAASCEYSVSVFG